MNIGWSKLYSYLTRKPGKYSAVGIEYNQNGIHLCALKKENEGHVWSLSQSFPLNEWQDKLAEFVTEHGMENSHTVIAFATKKYQLVQTDRPQVPDEELAQALQWSIKDLIVTQDEVVTDYFDLPAQTTGANKINVVALPKDELYAVCKGVINANLFLRTVTVEELCNCDLLPESADAYLAVTQDPGAEVCLNIIKNRDLYFSRRIRGYESLRTYTEAELQMGVIDNLSVELQRSMDFFEGQLRQAPVKKIILQLDNPNLDVMTKMVSEAMQVATEALNPRVLCAEGIAFTPADMCALGAAKSLVIHDLTEASEDTEQRPDAGPEDIANSTVPAALASEEFALERDDAEQPDSVAEEPSVETSSDVEPLEDDSVNPALDEKSELDIPEAPQAYRQSELDTPQDDPADMLSEPDTPADDSEDVMLEPETLEDDPVDMLMEPETLEDDPADMLLEPETPEDDPADMLLEPETLEDDPADMLMEPETPEDDPADMLLEPETPEEHPADMLLEPETPEEYPVDTMLEPETPEDDPADMLLEPEIPEEHPADMLLEPETPEEYPVDTMLEPETPEDDPADMLLEPDTPEDDPAAMLLEPETPAESIDDIETPFTAEETSLQQFGSDSGKTEKHTFSDTLNQERSSVLEYDSSKNSALELSLEEVDLPESKPEAMQSEHSSSTDVEESNLDKQKTSSGDEL